LSNTFIYGLVDPRDGRVRYVGKADKPAHRLQAHLKDTSTCHKVKWLNLLNKLGLRPDLVMLEEVPESEWQEAERKWVDHFGFDNLVNDAEPGWGGRVHLTEESAQRKSMAISRAKRGKATRTGAVLSEETKRKIGESRRGKLLDESVRNRMGEGQKRRWAAGRKPSQCWLETMSSRMSGENNPARRPEVAEKISRASRQRIAVERLAKLIEEILG
jgi:hypothetical protein